jgi:hypothetical protein
MGASGGAAGAGKGERPWLDSGPLGLAGRSVTAATGLDGSLGPPRFGWGLGWRPGMAAGVLPSSEGDNAVDGRPKQRKMAAMRPLRQPRLQGGEEKEEREELRGGQDSWNGSWLWLLRQQR